MTTSESDAVLLPFLLAPEGEEADGLCARLIAEHAEPVIRGVIRGKLAGVRRGAGVAEDAEDLRGEVVVRLLARLRELKSRPGENALADFRGYVAVVTFNAVNQLLRAKYPQRSRLKNRVRYLLSHDPDFELWEAGGDHLCGLSAWRVERDSAARVEDVMRAAENPRALEGAGLKGEDAARAELSELLAALFKVIGAPVSLDVLVNAVAELQGVKDARESAAARDDEKEDEASRLTDGRAHVSDEVERRLYLRALWEEISSLPPRQRAALLLNLRDAQGGVMELLPLAGVATIRQIACAVGIEAEEFARLWNELPLEDSRIAERLGVTRQQVINLRKAARSRLARRMKAWGGAWVGRG